MVTLARRMNMRRRLMRVCAMLLWVSRWKVGASVASVVCGVGVQM